MSFEKLIRERFSVREFKKNPVEREKLDKILQAGSIAPTARNQQPQRIKIIKTAQELAKIDECSPCRFGAPLVLLICYDKTACEITLSGETDLGIVVTHMVLQAWELGIGSCWVHWFDRQKIRELFDLPDNFVPVTLLPLGYTACDTSANFGNRFPVKDLIF